MHTQQKESEFKRLSKTIDDPTEQEANAWDDLLKSSRYDLLRTAGSLYSHSLMYSSWDRLGADNRMAIRAKTVFGGLHA